MNVMDVTTKVVKITTEGDNWLTKWTEEQDILYFSASKSVLTSQTQVKYWHEITDEQYRQLMERYEMAIAMEASGDGE